MSATDLNRVVGPYARGAKRIDMYSHVPDYRGDRLTRIWDEWANGYVTDAAGNVLVFSLPYQAQKWLEERWMEHHGIAS